MARIKKAIISVSDKKGLADFAKELSAMGIEILSTGGTAGVLRDAGIPVKDVSEHTGSLEMLTGESRPFIQRCMAACSPDGTTQRIWKK